MSIDSGHFRELTANLKENLSRCAQNPDVDAVHDTRTGTRRIEAMLETTLRELTPAKEEVLYQSIHSLMRLLKKIRRAAAPVRDLDVHRKLLEKLVPREKNHEPASMADILQDVPLAPATQQAEDLDAWLKHQRHENEAPLQKSAAKWAEKLEKQMAGVEDALRAKVASRGGRRAPVKRPAKVALDNFALLATEMQLLDALNLHDFRKGAKKARYVAESGGEDESAKAVGGALKRLQDEIGDWHDWLVLADEARRALGAQGTELTSRIETERDQHYDSAMKMAARLRGRLMGEWLAKDQPLRRQRLPRRPATTNNGQ
ncbi:CHAD domain-containing protein [Paracidobacterium acidisoli]|uniref:CHAD domain-containing protein n=1 Tax=Paracidobacterium acidisoli TaxID=2303751 RepID=A0A372IPP4_9BACT|nr:CHAD domain-containing protein [Paracidobacterium acidisoli]MBT9331009.1 CHAD domain-containing protein [Paracidobacterium acidisoli]